MQKLWEVFTSDDHWVIRVQPSGVPLRRDLWHFNVGRRVLRWLRRDHRWVLSIRRAANDPWGAAEIERTVSSRSEVTRAIDDLARQLRTGSQFHT